MFPLEKLCLDVIAKNFERFYLAFAILKDDNIEPKFLFLQRRYSVQLLTSLYVSLKLKDEFFELLINEHLNVLVGNWFRRSCYLNSMKNIFCRLPNLTRICFRHCDDELLKYVAKFCPKIVEIDVQRSRVSDEGIKYLYESENGVLPCPALKNLFINCSLVTEKGVEGLIRNLSSLEKIDYKNLPLLIYSIHKENLPELKDVQRYNLVELDLSGLRYTETITFKNGFRIIDDGLKDFDILKTCLILCPKLETIAVYASNEKELNLIANSHLKKLHLKGYMRSKIDINNFQKTNGCNLTSLKICNLATTFSVNACAVSVPLLAARCSDLKEFYAHSINFTDDNDDKVKVIFPSLTKCVFSQFDSSDVEMICLLLASSPKLESISFRFICKLPHVARFLPQELKNQILVWCKSPFAKLIEFVYLDLEKEFIQDILLSGTNLKAIFLYRCEFYVPDIKSFLCSFVEELHIKTKVFIQILIHRGGMNGTMAYINFTSTSLDYYKNCNLEYHLREDYKYSNIYEHIFPEIAVRECDRDADDDWEDDWEIVSS